MRGLSWFGVEVTSSFPAPFFISQAQPDPKRVRQACGRAEQVVIYAYGRGADLWWSRSQAVLERSQNLRVMSLPVATTQDLARLARRTMQLQCTIQDGHVWLGDTDHAVEVALTTLQGLPNPSGTRHLL